MGGNLRWTQLKTKVKQPPYIPNRSSDNLSVQVLIENYHMLSGSASEAVRTAKALAGGQ